MIKQECYEKYKVEVKVVKKLANFQILRLIGFEYESAKDEIFKILADSKMKCGRGPHKYPENWENLDKMVGP